MDHAYTAAGVAETIYVALDLTAYWIFAFKYWTTSLAIDRHVKELEVQ